MLLVLGALFWDLGIISINNYRNPNIMSTYSKFKYLIILIYLAGWTILQFRSFLFPGTVNRSI